MEGEDPKTRLKVLCGGGREVERWQSRRKEAEAVTGDYHEVRD